MIQELPPNKKGENIMCKSMTDFEKLVGTIQAKKAESEVLKNEI